MRGRWCSHCGEFGVKKVIHSGTGMIERAGARGVRGRACCNGSMHELFGATALCMLLLFLTLVLCMLFLYFPVFVQALARGRREKDMRESTLCIMYLVCFCVGCKGKHFIRLCIPCRNVLAVHATIEYLVRTLAIVNTRVGLP